MFNKFYSYLSEEIVNSSMYQEKYYQELIPDKIPFIGQDTATEIFLTDFDYTDRIKQLLDTSFNKYLNQNIISSAYPIKTLTTLKNQKPLLIPDH